MKKVSVAHSIHSSVHHRHQEKEKKVILQGTAGSSASASLRAKFFENLPIIQGKQDDG
jgi:hypothetical protein